VAGDGHEQHQELLALVLQGQQRAKTHHSIRLAGVGAGTVGDGHEQHQELLALVLQGQQRAKTHHSRSLAGLGAGIIAMAMDSIRNSLRWSCKG
jgi:uncharacterized protein YhfF